MKSNHDDAERILNRALEFPAQEREAFLSGACANDAALRDQVATLLRAHEEADEFLNQGITLGDEAVSEGPGSKIGRYKLLQQVGEGGMGVVYMAEQTEPVKRKVALKIIKLGMDTKQVVARFEAERQALAMMDHPNIAKVLDAGATETGRSYFVMELVRGVPVTEYCDKNKLSTKRRLELFIPICQAIQHAHQKGVIHRDIKPSNVMVTLHDGDPVPKVIDFGIAKAINQKLTERTLFTNYAQMIGTPAYMSPEQAELSGLDVDTRTDVYSLGVLLYELLTGTTPFSSRDLLEKGYGEMQRIIAEDEPPKPSTRLSTMQNEDRTVVARNRSMEVSKLGRLFQGDLDWIVMKALEKDRTRRYETANGLVEDVRRHLTNEPVNAAAPTFSYQLTKFYHRNRDQLRIAVIFVGLLIVATIFSGYQALRAQRAVKGLEKERKTVVGLLENEKEIRGDLETEKFRVEGESELRRRKVYAADMFRASKYAENGNLEMLHELLSEHIPKANSGQEDLRDEAWRYLWTQRRGDELETIAQDVDLRCDLAVSPKGRWIAYSNGEEVVVRVAMPPWRHVVHLPEKVNSLTFSADERWLAGGTDDRVVIWQCDGTDDWNLERRLDGYSYPTRFSRDGRWLAARKGHAYALLETPSFQERKQFSSVPLFDFTVPDWRLDRNTIAFSKDGRLLTLLGEDEKRQFVDLNTLEQIEELSGLIPNSLTVALSPDSRRIYFNQRAGQAISIWNIGDASSPSETILPSGRALGVSLSPDGQRLAVASIDMSIGIYEFNLDSFQLVNRLFGHLNEIWNLEWASDSRWGFSSSLGGALKVWDFGQNEHEDLPDSRRVSLLGFAGDEEKAYGIVDQTEPSLFLWDLESDSQETTLVEGKSIGKMVKHRGDSRFSISKSMQRIAFALENGSVRVWDHRERNLWDEIPIEPGEEVMAVCFHPRNEDLLAVGTGSGRFELWDLRQRTVREQWPVQPGGAVSLCFSTSGDMIACTTETAGGYQARCVVYETQDSSLLLEMGGEYYGAAFSPVEPLLVLARSTGEIVAYDLVTNKERYRLNGHVLGVDRICFSPNGRTFFSGGNDWSFKIWHARTGTEMVNLPWKGKPFPYAVGERRALVGNGFQSPVIEFPTLAEIDQARAKTSVED